MESELCECPHCGSDAERTWISWSVSYDGIVKNVALIGISCERCMMIFRRDDKIDNYLSVLRIYDETQRYLNPEKIVYDKLIYC